MNAHVYSGGHWKSRSLTILVPAYNEQDRLPITVREAFEQARATLDAFEIIIINDGSKDHTDKVAERLARTYPHVQVRHQPVNLGVGAAYRTGLEMARYPFLTLIPGDNAFHHTGVRSVFEQVGQADLVISYRHNPRARTPLRRVLSRFATMALRILTGASVRDAHSMYVWPVDLIRRIPVNAGYGYHIETLSTLLQSGLSFVEVPVLLNPKPDASSGVMRPQVLASMIYTMARLYLRRFVIGTAVGRREIERSRPLPGSSRRAA